MGNLLRQLPVKRRLGSVIELWLEVHQPYHTTLDCLWRRGWVVASVPSSAIPRYNHRMAPEDTPATKRDIHALEERLLERMRDMQTELLKAFLPYQEQTRLRDSALEARQPPWKRAPIRSKSA